MVASIGSGQIISRTGKYKIFMQVGIVLATVMVGLLATLTPESSYEQEAFIMVLLGVGLGLVMPVLNIAVQNEFKQLELGVATSSIQLFRGLGSTIGIAVFGAILTGSLSGQLAGITDDRYVMTVSQSPLVQRIGNVNDPNTLLTLNTPDVKQQINHAFETQSTLSPSTKDQARETFYAEQEAYASRVTHAFSDSLRGIFVSSAVLMAIAAGLVMFIRERELAPASPHTTPGEV